MSEFPAHLFRMDGDPSLIRGSADRWMAFGEAATNAATQIRSLDTSQFVGPEGDLYREGLNAEMPEHLDITGEAFSMVAEALSTFAGTLDSLQQQMRPLAERAPRLWEAVQAARARVAEAEAADRADGAVSGLKFEAEATAALQKKGIQRTDDSPKCAAHFAWACLVPDV